MIKRYRVGKFLAQTYFTSDTNISGSSSFYQADVNIVGQASAVVTVKVTAYTVTNIDGKIFVNTNQVFLNDTFTISLNGSGNGHFTVKLQGDASNTGTVVFCTFTITGATLGKIGSPSTHNESKVF